jgi:hypothetical protein
MSAADKIDTDGPLTLIVAWRSGRNAHGRVLKAGGDVSKKLREIAVNARDVVSENQGRDYNPDDEQDDECLLLRANRDELLDTALLTQIEKGASLPLIDPTDLRRKSIALYAVLIGKSSGKRSIFIRKGSPVSLANKSLIAAVLDDTLTRVTDPILAFDNKFDVILTDENVWVLHQNSFELMFKESDAVLAKTADWASELGKSLPIDDAGQEWLATRLRQTSVMRRKVQSILRSNYLETLSLEVIRQKIVDRGLNPDELLKDGVLVFNKDTEKSILLFLNEDLWTGDFSGTQYAAARKAPR